MSVWKYPVYRDDALEALCKVFPHEFIRKTGLLDAANFVVEDFGNFPVPKNLRPGCLKDQVLDEENPVNLEDLYHKCTIEYDEDDGVLSMFKKNKEVKCGLKACYNLAYRILQNKIGEESCNPEETYLIRNGYVLGEMASYMGPGRAAQQVKESYADTEKIMNRLKNFRLFVVTLKSMAKNRKLSRQINLDRNYRNLIEYQALPEGIRNFLPGYEFFFYGGLTFITDDNMVTAFVLTNKDVDRVYQVVRGVQLYDAYITHYTNSKDLMGAIAVRKLFIDSLINNNRPNFVCRAWDLVFNYVISPVDITNKSKELLRKKIYEEKLNEIVNPVAVEVMLSNMKIREVIDILNIRKCLPTPDFDYFGAAERQRVLWSEPNKFLKQNVESENVEELKSYYKYMMVRAYYKRHGKLPGTVKEGVAAQDWHPYWPDVNIKNMDYHFVNDLNLTGTFEYNEVRKDVMQLVKDSAIIPNVEFENGYDVNRMDVKNKNMLADVFTRRKDIDVNEINLNDYSCDVKAEDKPEAKKPNGRWFFELNTDERLKQSEYEMNQSEYVKHMPGCAVGLSHDKMLKKMNYVTSGVLEGGPVRNFLESFDLHRFSPNYPGQVHEAINEVNADLYGKPYLKHAHLVHHKGNVVYAKKSIKHVQPKAYVDLEGFSGKFNSCVHACIMGLAVHKARAKAIITTGAKLAVFIDDGLLCIRLQREGYEDTVNRLVAEIDRVYSAYGFVISYDKTFLSSNLAVFLHNFTYNGRKLSGGLKSYLKVDNYQESVVDSIVNDLEFLESKIRATMENGTDHRLAYLTYMYLVVDTLRRWNRKKVRLKLNILCWLFAPVSMGGLGIKTVMQLSGSLEHDIQTGWLAVIMQTKRRVPVLKQEFNRILNQNMRPKKAEETLYGAGVCRVDGHSLNNFRLQRIIENHLMNSEYLRERVNVLGFKNDSLLYMITNLHEGSVPIFVRKRVFNATVVSKLNRVTDKFLRSRTAIKVIGKRAWVKVKFSNMKDAEKFFDKI